MTGARVLVVDDDATITDVVSRYLRQEGYAVATAADGTTALDLARRTAPDLVVLDVMLPGIDGLEVARRLRGTSTTPIILLTALGETEDRIAGFEVGADDYLVKPFSPRELLLRIQGLLRREERLGRTGLVPRRVTRGPLSVDTAARTADLRGRRLRLTQREFDLLAFLLDHPGEAFGKRDLLRRVWGWDFGDTSTVVVHVRRLREKVEQDPSDPHLVLTVRGSGYRFATEEELVGLR